MFTIQLLADFIKEYTVLQGESSPHCAILEEISNILKQLDGLDMSVDLPEKQLDHLQYIITSNPNPTKKTAELLNKLSKLLALEKKPSAAVMSSTSTTIKKEESSSSSGHFFKDSTNSEVTFTKTIKSSVSLLYNDCMSNFSNWHERSHIMTGIFLGQIPHTNLLGDTTDEINKIKNGVLGVNPKRPLGLVISVTEEAEVSGRLFLFNKTVKPTEWAAAGITQYLLNMPDFSPDVKLDDCIEALEMLEKCIAQGESALVHCKAGRARSAMFLAIYMALNVDKPGTNDRYSISEAIAFLTENRAQVSVGDKKMKAAQYVVQSIKEMRAEHNKNEYSLLISPLEKIVSSKELKEIVLNSREIIELKKYQAECKGSNREEYIVNILNLIHKPHSERWFTLLMREAGSVNRLLQAHPKLSVITEESRKIDKELRRDKIDTLKQFVLEEVKKLLIKNGLSSDALEDYINIKMDSAPSNNKT